MGRTAMPFNAGGMYLSLMYIDVPDPAGPREWEIERERERARLAAPATDATGAPRAGPAALVRRPGGERPGTTRALRPRAR